MRFWNVSASTSAAPRIDSSLTDIPEGVLIAFAFILGLIFGSFGTVVSYRVPRGESISTPKRSFCLNCQHQISFIENIPVFSYLFLRGRCRHCGTNISPRYPLTELLTAILFAAAAAKFDATVEAVAYALFFWTLVVLAVIDLEHKKLPDKIVLPLVVGGVGLLALAAGVDGSFGEFSPVALISALVAIAISAFMFWPASEEEGDDEQVKRRPLNVYGILVLAGWGALTTAAFVEREQTWLAGAVIGAAVFSGFFFSVGFTVAGGMGGGDIKLALALGAFSGYLGAPGTPLVAMFMSLVVGGVISMIFLTRGGSRKDQLPFGPFLALGTTIAIFFGQELQDWYGGLF